MVVDAPPEKIWPLLVAIPGIGHDEGIRTVTHDWLDVPRPSDARLFRGDGELVRVARWGDDIRFEEQITEFVPDRAIGWRFAFPDNSVQRYTDRHISPDGPMLRIETGRYDLAELPDGRTRLILTTSYSMRTRLGWYLGWWGERLLGDVSENVLAIVAARAER